MAKPIKGGGTEKWEGKASYAKVNQLLDVPLSPQAVADLFGVSVRTIYNVKKLTKTNK